MIYLDSSNISAFIDYVLAGYENLSTLEKLIFFTALNMAIAFYALLFWLIYISINKIIKHFKTKKENKKV